MPNRIRGEISAQLDGRRWTLVLTLGALAELENAFDCKSLSELLARFSADTLSAKDMVVILGAGLRGAGHDVSDDQVAMMQATGGVAGFAAVTADLLSAAFGDPTPESEDNRQDND
ncbi:MAG: gene transfer agent family protein [Roseibium sp.]